MKTRPLPDRRENVTQKAIICTPKGPVRTYLTVGLHADGTPGEIFFTVENQGDELRLAYNLVSILVSLGLQYGVPLEAMVEQCVGMKGDISGPVKCHGRIRLCSSVPDYLGRDLAINFMGREDLAHIKSPGEEAG